MSFGSVTKQGSKKDDALWNLVKDFEFLKYEHHIEQIKPSYFDFPDTSVQSEDCADFSIFGIEVIRDYLHIGLVSKKTFKEPLKRNRILLLVKPQFVSPGCYQNRKLYLIGLKKIKTLVFRVPDSVYLKYSKSNNSLNEIVAAAAILTQVEDWKLLERAVISSFYHLTYDKPNSELSGDIDVWNKYPKDNLNTEWKQLLYICCGPQGFAYLFKKMIKRNWAKIARNSISSDIEGDGYSVLCTGEIVSLLLEWVKLFFKPDGVMKFLEEINSVKPALVGNQISNMASASFQKHKRSAKLHRCSDCPYETNYNSHYVIHLRAHSGECPFVCVVCDSTFKQQAHLKVHEIKYHTGRYPFQCQYCGKPFVNHSVMKYHVSVHEKKGNVHFQCYKCSHITKDEEKLKEHMPIHAKDPTFECAVCRKIHDSQTALNAHLRNHSKDKPFKCHICGRGFLFEHALRGHYNTHSDSRAVFTCRYCSKNLATYRSLRTHEVAQHGEQ